MKLLLMGREQVRLSDLHWVQMYQMQMYQMQMHQVQMHIYMCTTINNTGNWCKIQMKLLLMGMEQVRLSDDLHQVQMHIYMCANWKHKTTNTCNGTKYKNK